MIDNQVPTPEPILKLTDLHRAFGEVQTLFPGLDISENIYMGRCPVHPLQFNADTVHEWADGF